MEGISANVYKGLRSYWKRKGYKRLQETSGVDAGAQRECIFFSVQETGIRIDGGIQRERNPFFSQDAVRTVPAQCGPGKEKTVVLGRKRRSWRVKIGKRIRIWKRIGSPKKWLTRLRDAYVKMMLNLSSSGMVGGGLGGSTVYGSGFGKGPVKEYDEKVIVEIYKSLVMAQGRLVPREAPKITTRPPIMSTRSVIRI